MKSIGPDEGVTEAPENDTRFLDVDGVALRLGCSRKCAIGVMQEANAIRLSRETKSWRISRERLDRWLCRDLSTDLVRQSRPDPSAEYVYFIECNAGPIKIGYTKNVERRITHVRMLSPYEIVLRGLMLGGKRLESALHGRFHAQHIRGEWFKQEGELADLLERAPQ